MEKVAGICYIFYMNGNSLFRKLNIRLLFAGLLFTALVFSAAAQSRFAWFAEGSVLFFPEDNGRGSDPMPILPSLGAGFGLQPFNNESLRLEITLDMYFTVYDFNDTLDRAVPASWENRSAFVWGSILGVQGSYVFNIRPNIALRVFGGPAADLRIILLAPDLNESIDPMDTIRQKTDAVSSYFWSKGRWFLPVAGTGMDFDLNEKFRLGFDLRVWMPAYKLWSGEDLPLIEGWRFGVGARITFL